MNNKELQEITKEQFLTILPERFTSKVNFTEYCWLWTSAISSSGYGLFTIKNKHERAHRMSWAAFNGEIPEKIDICHKCDVRTCVNPNHLFAGSRKQNIDDCRSKDRMARGEKQGLSKLTQEQVDEIRRVYKPRDRNGNSLVDLAARFKVSCKTISSIVNYERWNGPYVKDDLHNAKQVIWQLRMDNKHLSEEREGLKDELETAYNAYEKLQKEYERLDGLAAKDVEENEQLRNQLNEAEEEIKEAMGKEWELAGEPTPVYIILRKALSHIQGKENKEIAPYDPDNRLDCLNWNAPEEFICHCKPNQCESKGKET